MLVVIGKLGNGCTNCLLLFLGNAQHILLIAGVGVFRFSSDGVYGFGDIAECVVFVLIELSRAIIQRRDRCAWVCSVSQIMHQVAGLDN